MRARFLRARHEFSNPTRQFSRFDLTMGKVQNAFRVWNFGGQPCSAGKTTSLRAALRRLITYVLEFDLGAIEDPKYESDNNDPFHAVRKLHNNSCAVRCSHWHGATVSPASYRRYDASTFLQNGVQITGLQYKDTSPHHLLYFIDTARIDGLEKVTIQKSHED